MATPETKTMLNSTHKLQKRVAPIAEEQDGSDVGRQDKADPSI